MGTPRDVVNEARRCVKPPIHGACDWAFGGYAMSRNTEDEYVGTVPFTESAFETILAEELGFSRNVVSSLKIRVDGNVSDGSWVRRSSRFDDWQLHAMLHTVEDGVEVYAHWEYNWITHPYKHYCADGVQPERGVEMMREMLREHESERFPDGIPFEVESFYWRPPWYLTLVHRELPNGLARWLSGIARREKRRFRVADL